jgi:hypothetical protein
MKAPYRTENTALVVALLVFAFLAACFQIYSHDTGFHIKTGEWIDAHGELPETDPFSFTRAGKPWPVHQGNSAWIFWRVYSAWGVEGLISFKALIVMLTYGLVLWTAWRESGLPALAICATALGVLAGRYRFYERPMLLSAFLLAALWACLSEHRRTRSTAPLAIGVGILTVWANLHAGWIDGMITLGALAFMGTLVGARAGSGKLLPRVKDAFRQNRDLWLTWGAALILAVGTLSVLNPTGPKVLVFPFIMMRSDWFQSHVTEFLPLPLGNYYATWVLMVLTGGVLALAWVRKSLRATDAMGHVHC